jgi:hypothetical protein
MIHKLNWDGTWREIYRHPLWDLILFLHVHTDGYLYASGTCYEGGTPAGIVRSIDGTNWEVYVTSPFDYFFYGMTSKDGNLWTACTSSKAVWGKNNCRPSVYCNRDMVYTDQTRPNQGFFCQPCAFNGNLYFGGAGAGARVFRYEDKKTVLQDTTCECCLWIGTDGKKLYALFSNGIVNNSTAPAKCYVSSDGNSWKTIGSFTDNILFGGSFEDDGFYLAGGGCYQNLPSQAYGHIFKSK